MLRFLLQSKLLRHPFSPMIVGTTEAAQILSTGWLAPNIFRLKISTARLRVLLIAGRVEGSYKTGKMWLMPLFNGKPIIKRGTRGPAPRWRNPRKPAKTIIHVNSQRIRHNHKKQEQEPVITVKKGNTNFYGHQVEIPGGCRVVYSPNSPRCGAKVWIETLYDVKVTSLGAHSLASCEGADSVVSRQNSYAPSDAGSHRCWD